jgi:gamma-glutamylaminecyclotransferase
VLAGARFVRGARTAARYTLVDLGPYPALVEGGDTSVAGELYEVEEALLEVLDAFEGHPDVYIRMPVELAAQSEAQTVFEAYVLPADRAREFPRVPSGDWRGRRRDG